MGRASPNVGGEPWVDAVWALNDWFRVGVANAGTGEESVRCILEVELGLDVDLPRGRPAVVLERANSDLVSGDDPWRGLSGLVGHELVRCLVC
jgi:hypothetical protein